VTPGRRRIAVLLSLLSLGGCAHTTVVGAGRALDVRLTEYRLAPQDLRTHAGTLSIHVRNLGRLTHNFALATHGHPLATTKPIAPGAARWLFVALVPGRYTMGSTMLSDQALGLYGTLTIER